MISVIPTLSLPSKIVFNLSSQWISFLFAGFYNEARIESQSLTETMNNPENREVSGLYSCLFFSLNRPIQYMDTIFVCFTLSRPILLTKPSEIRRIRRSIFQW